MKTEDQTEGQPAVATRAVVRLPVDPPHNCADVTRQLGLRLGDVLQSKSCYSDTTHEAELLYVGNAATVWKVTDTYESGFVSTSEARWPVLIVGSHRRLHEWQKQNDQIAAKPL